MKMWSALSLAICSINPPSAGGCSTAGIGQIDPLTMELAPGFSPDRSLSFSSIIGPRSASIQWSDEGTVRGWGRGRERARSRRDWRPRCVLLDEPTKGTQPSIVHELGDVIRRPYSEEGMAVPLVEQKQPFARWVAERFLLMDRGAFVTTGMMSELSDELVRKHLAVWSGMVSDQASVGGNDRTVAANVAGLPPTLRQSAATIAGLAASVAWLPPTLRQLAATTVRLAANVTGLPPTLRQLAATIVGSTANLR
jgi:hypothetical protein